MVHEPRLVVGTLIVKLNGLSRFRFRLGCFLLLLLPLPDLLDRPAQISKEIVVIRSRLLGGLLRARIEFVQPKGVIVVFGRWWSPAI
jgi:hypothetical protein